LQENDKLNYDFFIQFHPQVFIHISLGFIAILFEPTIQPNFTLEVPIAIFFLLLKVKFICEQ